MRALAFTLALLAAGCAAAAGGTDDTESGKQCIPGVQIACACPGAASGVQVCDANGSTYSACDCSWVSGGQGGSSAGGSGGGLPPPPPPASGGSGGSSGSGGGSGGSGVGGSGTGGTGPGAGGTGSGNGGSSGSGVGGSAGGWGGGSYGPVGDYAGGVSISEVAVYQAVKVSLMKNGQEVTQKNAPIVEGRPALVRVSVAPGSGFSSRKLSALLDLESQNPAVQPQTTSLDVSGASSDASLGSTFNFVLPPEQVTADLKLAVSLHEPSGGSVGAVENGAKFPAQGKLALGAQSSGPMRVTFVPFRYNADGSGRLPDTSAEQMKRYHDILFAMFPTTKVELVLRDVVDYNYYVGPSSGWSSWLDKLCDIRQKDNVESKVYYYGLMAPASSWSSYGGGIAGLGNVPSADGTWGRCAVGIGFKDADTYGFIMAHEVGHTMGRPHAPCGVSGEAFPYTGAKIGVWGYSLTSQSLKDPAKYRDFMSYCDPQWISDYAFSKLFKRIQWVNQNYAKTPETPRGYRKLLVDVDGSVTWGGSITLGETPDGAPKRIDFLDDAGRAIGSVVGHFAAFSEEPAGALFVPDPGPGVSAIAPEGMAPVLLPAP